MKLSYEAWMRDVDDAVTANAGVSVHDLPDFPSRDYYDDGISPREAATLVLEENGWEGDE